MFSCLYKLMWIQVQHHLLKIQERRRPGLLRLLLRGKGDEGPRGVSSSSPSASRFPPSPLFSSFPSCSPSGTWIHPYLSSRGEEEARAPPPPSPRKRRRRSARRSSPSRRRRRRSPRSPPPSPPPSSPTPAATPTHPLCPDVCIVALPDGLIVVFLSFRLSPCAPSVLSPVFRCAVRGTSGSLASSSKRLIVMSCVIVQEQ